MSRPSEPHVSEFEMVQSFLAAEERCDKAEDAVLLDMQRFLRSSPWVGRAPAFPKLVLFAIEKHYLQCLDFLLEKKQLELWLFQRDFPEESNCYHLLGSKFPLFAITLIKDPSIFQIFVKYGVNPWKDLQNTPCINIFDWMATVYARASTTPQMKLNLVCNFEYWFTQCTEEINKKPLFREEYDGGGAASAEIATSSANLFEVMLKSKNIRACFFLFVKTNELDKIRTLLGEASIPGTWKTEWLLTFFARLAIEKKYKILKDAMLFAGTLKFPVLTALEKLGQGEESESFKAFQADFINELAETIIGASDEIFIARVRELFTTRAALPQEILTSTIDKFFAHFVISDTHPQRKKWMLNLNVADAEGNDWLVKCVLEKDRVTRSHWLVKVLEHTEKDELQNLILLAAESGASGVFWRALRSNADWCDFDFSNDRLFNFSAGGFLDLLLKNELAHDFAEEFIKEVAEGLPEEQIIQIVEQFCINKRSTHMVEILRVKDVFKKHYLAIFKAFLMDRAGVPEAEKGFVVSQIFQWVEDGEPLKEAIMAASKTSFFFWCLAIPEFTQKLLHAIKTLHTGEETVDKLLHAVLASQAKETRVFPKVIEDILFLLLIRKNFLDDENIKGRLSRMLSRACLVELLLHKPEFSSALLLDLKIDKVKCVIADIVEKSAEQYWKCFQNVLEKNESMANYFLETERGIPNTDAWSEYCRTVFTSKSSRSIKDRFIKMYLEKIPEAAFTGDDVGQRYRKKIFKLRLMTQIEAQAAESVLEDAFRGIMDCAPNTKDWNAPEYLNPDGNFFLWLISKPRNLSANMLSTFFSCNMVDADLESLLNILFSKISENARNTEYKKYLLLCANVLVTVLFRRVSHSKQKRWIEQVEKITFLNFSEKCSFFASEEIPTHLVMYFFECCRSHSDADKKLVVPLLAERLIKNQFTEGDILWLKREFTAAEVGHFSNVLLMQQFASRFGLEHVAGLAQKIIEEIQASHQLNTATLLWLRKNAGKFKPSDLERLVHDEQLSFQSRLELASIAGLSIDTKKDLKIKMIERAFMGELMQEDKQWLMEVTRYKQADLTFDQMMPHILFRFAQNEKNAEIMVSLSPLLQMEIPATSHARAKWLDNYYVMLSTVLDTVPALEQIEWMKNKKLNPEIFLMYLQYNYGKYADHLQLLRGYLDAAGLIVLYHAERDAQAFQPQRLLPQPAL